MEKLINVKNVSFAYGSQPILENINLDICRGDYMGIVGPNGSGKTTLLKLILGILKPAKGSIEVFGKSIERFSQWERVGYVRQKASFFNPGFPATVEEVISANIHSGKGFFDASVKRHRERVYEALSHVNMEEYGGRLIGNLSGGQQQRVFIARTLVNSPEILFLDEPTVGIDLDSQREFYCLLEKLNIKMRITIVMVSHDIGVIAQKVSRIVCMGDGKLICHQNSSGETISEALKKAYGDWTSPIIHDH
ncbi:MAG: metal ABC transporter ATP-binding protein [Clostridiales bacterium]|jgi:zinc transport system ATP-binding protein|nr:metal ABC transporter ATP-binding protein [Clostridiales bacterium]